MRIRCVTHRSDTPSTRYRLLPFAERFQKAGHETKVRRYSSGLAGLWPLLRDAREADAVVLQKRLPPAWMTRALRRRARRLCYDFDDAVYLRREGAEASTTRDRRFRAVLAAADFVVAGNSHLAGKARECR